MALGSSIPDPLNGRRIGQASGLSFHAPDGIERGGIGHLFNPETGLDRSSMGLDSPHGEGAILLADADGTNGLAIMDGDSGAMAFFGRALSDGVISTGDGKTRLGALVRNQSGEGVYVGLGASGVEPLGGGD